MSGHWMIVTTAEAMRKQADDALAAIAAANGGEEPPTLRDAYDIDPEAFAKLIEALLALGARVDDEMIRLAGIRPLDETLGGLSTYARNLWIAAHSRATSAGHRVKRAIPQSRPNPTNPTREGTKDGGHHYERAARGRPRRLDRREHDQFRARRHGIRDRPKQQKRR